MKLLLVADLHYTLRQWDWVLRTFEHFDAVVIAGDLLDLGSIVPLETQILVVEKYLQRLTGQVPLLVSSGNHDLLPDQDGVLQMADWIRDLEGSMLHSDGAGVEFGGSYFSILPWWESEEDLERVGKQLAEQAGEAAGRQWIWVYHAPPAESRVAWDGRKDFGDRELIGLVDKYRPAMVLGGHIHNAPFHARGSWIDEIDGCFFFNGGRQIGGQPTFTVIDTDEGRAVWSSLEGAEEANLCLPLVRRELE